VCLSAAVAKTLFEQFAERCARGVIHRDLRFEVLLESCIVHPVAEFFVRSEDECVIEGTDRIKYPFMDN
jgi:hypothetical protein